MTDRPIVPSETRKRRNEAREKLASEVDNLAEAFMTTLDSLAETHGCKPSYVHDLAGIACEKKAKKGHTTAWAAFCGLKLNDENKDKTKGSMTTMPGFFEANPGLHKEYKSLSDEAKTGVLKQHLQAKAEENKVNLTKYRSNSAISRAVDARVTIITTMCKDLNRGWNTEILFLFCRGDMTHTYSPGSFATEGASNWLANAEIGHNTVHNASYQMEGFNVSGCSTRVNNTNEGSAKSTQQEMRKECRALILSGFKNILEAKHHPQPNMSMNYEHYEDKIVEALGVHLVGWPLDDPVCNPGKMSTTQAIILSNALKSGECKWVNLTSEQVEARKASNAQRVSNGEQVYGPPRKKRARKASVELEGDSHEMNQDTIYTT